MSRIFSSAQRSLIDAILDTIIPEDGDLPGAGGAGTAEYLDSVLSENPTLTRLVLEGLDLIQIASEGRGGGFETLSDADRTEILRGSEVENPRFFETLLAHAYNGYYTNPEVLEALGMDARAPQPTGHQVSRGEFSALDAVTRAGQAYRDA